MLPSKTIAFHLLAIPGLLIAIAFASAVAPEIKDKAHFFKEETVHKVDSLTREISKEFDRDVVIETVLAVPADQLVRVKAMSAEDRTKFFNNWCSDRAEATVTHGLYILICKDPPHLALEITDRARPAFGQDGRDKMLSALLKAFKEQRYDEGIVAAVEFARSRFAAVKK
jgi:TPM domain